MMADTQKILEQINLLMDEYLQNPSLIQLEILQEKTCAFYEQLHKIKLNKHHSTPIVVEETKQTESQNQVVSTPINKEPKNEPKEVAKTTEEPAIKTEPVKEEVPPTPLKKAEEDKKLNLETKETIADRYTSQTSMNDLLANIEKDPDLATQLENRPIDNLKTAISLNDRIWFIQELFNNDADLFEQSIEKINQAETVEKAIDIIAPFNWNDEKDSTKQFIKLIYRKFV